MKSNLEIFLERMTFPSILAFLLVVGGFSLAIIDSQFRGSFANLAQIGLGGYLAQHNPNSKKKEGDSNEQK